MACTGVGVDDFVQILADFTRTVSYQVVTKTTDSLTGDETSAFGVASPQGVVFLMEENRYLFDKEGLLEVGDAYIMAPLSLGIKRYDQFSVDGRSFYVKNVIPRYVVGVHQFDYAVCFLVT